MAPELTAAYWAYLSNVLAQLGPDKLLFGSDFPRVDHDEDHVSAAERRYGPLAALPFDMSIPVEITFHGMLPSPAVEVAVARWVDRLEHVYDRILRCHVWIDLPHRHHRSGAQFQVRVAVSVPGHEIAVVHDPGRGEAHDNVYPAIADAFVAARRQLQDYARIRRGDVKSHVA